MKLDDLLIDYLHDELDEEKTRQVARQLAQDPILLNRYVELTIEETAIERRAKKVSEPSYAELLKERPSVLPKRKPEQVSAGHFQLPWRPIFGAVAACLALAVILLSFNGSEVTGPIAHIDTPLDSANEMKSLQNKPKSEIEDEAGKKGPNEPNVPGSSSRQLLGELIGGHAVLDTPLVDGVKLTDQTYRLKEGTAHIRLASQVALSFEAPMTFKIQDAMNLDLKSGRMHVHVPEGAEGFTVHTPTAKVVDLGTKFGVSYDEATGVNQILVFDGAVDVSSNLAQDKVHHLKVGDLIAMSRTGEILAVTLSETDFISAHSEQAAYQKWRDELLKDRSVLHYYDFEPNAKQPDLATDVIGAGHGRMIGLDVVRGRRLGGSSVRFDGGGDALALDAEGQYQQLTLSAWLMLDDVQDKTNILFKSGQANSTMMKLRIWGGEQVKAGIGHADFDSTDLLIQNSHPLQDEQWHHVTAVFDLKAGGIKTYIDGRLNSSRKSDAPDVVIDLSQAVFGQDAAGLGKLHPSFKGRLDELLLFSKALTDTEVKTLYENTCVDFQVVARPEKEKLRSIEPQGQILRKLIDIHDLKNLAVPVDRIVSGPYQGLDAIHFRQLGDGIKLDMQGRYEQLTMMGWVYLDSEARQMPNQMLFKSADEKPGGMLFFISGREVVNASVWKMSEKIHNKPTRTLPAETWMHLAVTYDMLSRRITTYVDGNKHVARGIKRDGVKLDLKDARIGYSHSKLSQFRGKLSGFTIYQGAMNAQQIQAVYMNRLRE